MQRAVLRADRRRPSPPFGLPGAAINPLYSALREHQGISHILARHVEAASHMAEGYTRARAGNIGVCIGTSGPLSRIIVRHARSTSVAVIFQRVSNGQACDDRCAFNLDLRRIAAVPEQNQQLAQESAFAAPAANEG